MNNEFDEIILTLSREVDSVFISLNDARAENERLRAVLKDIQTCAGYHSGAGGWVVSESLMDEIADVLGNNEASES